MALKALMGGQQCFVLLKSDFGKRSNIAEKKTAMGPEKGIKESYFYQTFRILSLTDFVTVLAMD